MTTPDDLPAGLAGVETMPLGRLAWEIEDEELFDAGLHDYGEFFCSLNTAARLLREGMTYLGQPGTVSVVSRFTNGAQLKWRREWRRAA